MSTRRCEYGLEGRRRCSIRLLLVDQLPIQLLQSRDHLRSDGLDLLLLLVEQGRVGLQELLEVRERRGEREERLVGRQKIGWKK